MLTKDPEQHADRSNLPQLQPNLCARQHGRRRRGVEATEGSIPKVVGGCDGDMWQQRRKEEVSCMGEKKEYFAESRRNIIGVNL